MGYVTPPIPEWVIKWHNNPNVKPWQRREAKRFLLEYRAHLQEVLASSPYRYMRGGNGIFIVIAVVVVLGAVLFAAIRSLAL